MIKLPALNRICEHLEKYVFDRVWNEPYMEYRTFLVPALLTKVPTAGIFIGRYGQIQLPLGVSPSTRVNPLFHVYAIPAAFLQSIRLKVMDWTTMDDFCNENLMNLEVFSESGRHVDRSGIYLCQAPKNTCVLMAIDESVFGMCLGKAQNPKEIYFGKYFDSDLQQSIRHECIRLRLDDVNQDIGSTYNPVTKSGEPTYALYNGRLLSGDYRKGLTAGGLIEKVYDDNIVGVVDIPCTAEDSPKYLADEYGTRLLVHIPKAMNPDHVFITPNTCDIYVVPTKMVDDHLYPETNGFYLFQCGREEKFHQITHNDFSIDYEWLRHLVEAQGITEFHLRMFVKTQGKKNKAIRDANYLNLLYWHDDKDIVDFLLGKGDESMYFWKANYLENQSYANALIRRRHIKPKAEDQCQTCGLYSICQEKPKTDESCPSYNFRNLHEFIDILGYYHTLALVGKRVTHFEVMRVPDKVEKVKFLPDGGTEVYPADDLEPRRGEFIVEGPVGLCDLEPVEFYPVVYLNGTRVEQSKVSIGTGYQLYNRNLREVRFTDDAKWWTKVIESNYATKIRVLLDKSIVLKVGDRVTIELFENPSIGGVHHIKGATVIQMKTPDEWKVYRAIVCATDNNVVYEPIEEPGTFDKETLQLTLDEKFIDEELVIVEGPQIAERVGKDEGYFDVDYSSVNYLGREVWRDANEKFDNFPLDSELVFMNDKRLLKDLDYTMDGYGRESLRAGAKLYIQNVEWLRKKHNHYSVLRSTQWPLNVQRGYLKGNIIHWNHSNPFWFDEISILTVDGDVCSDLLHDIGTITTKTKYPNGTPFEVKISVAKRIVDAFGNHGLREDTEKMLLIKEYYRKRNTIPDYQTMVRSAYKVYSIYTEMIITEYLRKGSEFDFELMASKEAFEEQFKQFSCWKERDVVFRFNKDDFRYVDVYPLYNRLQIPDRYTYNKISQMVKMLLPPDSIRHKDAHNVR